VPMVTANSALRIMVASSIGTAKVLWRCHTVYSVVDLVPVGFLSAAVPGLSLPDVLTRCTVRLSTETRTDLSRRIALRDCSEAI
jgi:hypothetical protein